MNKYLITILLVVAALFVYEKFVKDLLEGKK